MLRSVTKFAPGGSAGELKIAIESHFRASFALLVSRFF
jgi:hypothetical protein